jgi:alpha-L-fucosidase
MRWQEIEYYAFVHFSLNTYTNQSWGYGNEDVKLFNPEKLDCRQLIVLVWYVYFKMAEVYRGNNYYIKEFFVF